MLINSIYEASDFILSLYDKPIDLAIILGSGLGELADSIENPLIIPYEKIPHFPISTIEGHQGILYNGSLEGKTILAMKGRVHYYEGYSMEEITFPVRVFKSLGISQIILTNACGGIRDDLDAGSIVFLEDHCSLFCPSPLRGPNLNEFGPRFKDMSEVYSKRLLNIAYQASKNIDVPVSSGIYGYYPGPMFETPADIRAYKVLGCDLAGMSTVPEAIIARHSDMEILGISLVTNKAAGLSDSPLSHQDVQNAAGKASVSLQKLVREIIKDM